MINDERKNTKMMPAICTHCGGPVEVDAQRENAICQYCGMQFIVEKAKTNALESMLSFARDQQKHINDVRKEKKEEERKEREESRKYLWIYIVLFILLMAFINFKANEEKSNEISINNSSSELAGKNYQDVVIKLQKNGFINIKTEAMEDLVVGWLTKDGDVEQVEINGSNDFSSGTKFPKDAEIIVTYHTFPVKK